MVTLDHVPVLYRETLEGLAPRPGGRYIDCTVGSGGHAAGILEASAPDGAVLALDADPEAVERAQARLGSFGPRATVLHGNFRDLEALARRACWELVDGILLDLGVSSSQLRAPQRGFSFQTDGPLDMRMNPEAGASAADLVNDLSEADLARLIWEYGEEPQSKRIGAAIVRQRLTGRIETTAQLAELVARAKGRRGRIHPATKVFQALRIAVNGELESIALVLPQTVRLLRPGGRLAVITFHSLEDRIVKQYMREEAKECRCPTSQLMCTCDRLPLLRLVNRHAIQPMESEVLANPRARSGLLRLAERL